MIRKNQFTRAERQAGEAAWLLGASFITEEAILRAASLRVIPGLMVGSAVTGALVMGFGNDPGAARRHLGGRPDQQADPVHPGHPHRHRRRRQR